MFRRLGHKLSRGYFANTQYQKNDVPSVHMTFDVNGTEHKIKIKLYEHLVPETAENFRQLCNGTHKLSYKNTKLTKAVPNLLIEAGNVGGDGSETIYGKGMWKERTDDSKFDKRGIVAMVDCAPEKNGSKFFITLGDFTHLDYTQVVVGEVIEGLNEVYLLSRTGDNTGTPRVEVSISDCGEGETLHLVEPHHHGHGHH